MKPGKSQHIVIIITILLLIPLLVQAQYKQDVPSIPGLRSYNTGSSSSILGIDLSRVNFYNSYSMQMSSMGGDAVAMGLLRSSFDYAINPQISVRGYVGLMHSPFSSITPIDEQYSFINGFNNDNILYGGEITYQPKENLYFHIGINKLPTNNLNQFFAPNFYRPRGY
ncbi:MAG: hypothetical protein U9Q77_09290 [Candidatus Marinimicrobia bacterium]|nr:hypothetical protein [Candidatus Neomarinimicrobiota bacterium]